MKCKPARCPDCGGPLSTPSMMNGCMTCQDCGHPWDQEWLCRFTAALAACRRALTMAEAIVEHETCRRDWAASDDWAKYSARPHMATCPKHNTQAAIKAARTAMDKAQGRSK